MRKKNSPTSPAWRGNFRIFSSKLPLQFSTSFLESGRFQKAKMLENRINPGFFYLSFGRTHHFWKENTQNRRKHWVFAGFLFARVAWLCGALWFGHWVFSPWFYSFPTVLIPSSTQNAPGFAFFWLFRVRFSLFRCFLAAKFSGCFLYTLPYSGYRLKPSVIPCKREVSFLT